MRRRANTLLGLCVCVGLTFSAARGQVYESHVADCIETAPLGTWSPWVEYDTDIYRGQWFRADGPLGGSCSSGGAYFPEGNPIVSGAILDLRVLGVGNHFLTAKLRPHDRSQPTIRKVWQVQVTEPGDVDGDGRVDMSDFLSFSLSYGGQGRELGDLNYDGFVGFGDFMILSRNFGNVSASSAANVQTVPESGRGTALLFCVCLYGLFRQRRK